MKLKTLFLFLNIVLLAGIALCFFCFFSLLPLASVMDGSGSTPPPLAAGIWICCVAGFVLLVALAAADVFWARHAGIFSCLSAENWPGLADQLEKETLGKGRLRKVWVSLFTDVLVLLSDYETLRKLFARLKAEKPALYRQMAPDFAAASVAFGNPDEAASCLETVSSQPEDWAAFYTAFLAFRKGRYREASEQFAALAASAADPVVIAVAGYYCGKVIPEKTFGIGIPQETLAGAASAAVRRVRRLLSQPQWEKLRIRSGKKVRAAVLGKTVQSAGLWIYSAPEPDTGK